MVNYGVSRGCENCRRRKKKCDEGRPTCERCKKAGISCLGYRSPDQLLFYHHYVIRSVDPIVSRGFLDGLPFLLFKSHPTSHVVQAAEIVGWASLGDLRNRLDVLARARTQHISILDSFPGLYHSCRSSGLTLEVLVTATLLGLYEIISGSENHPVPEEGVHGRDICTLFLDPNSSFDLITSMQSLKIANPLLIKDGLQVQPASGSMWTPSSSETIKDLDSILVKCQPLLERANTILQDPSASWIDLNQFSRWETIERHTAWDLEIMGHLTQADADALPCPYVSPGPVHSYSAIYTAAVMNTYRVTYLSLLDVLICLAPRCDFRNGQTLFKWENHAWRLIGDFVLSIPFHLARSTEEYVASTTARSGQPPVGRYVGGLFLLHLIYVLSSTPLVPPYYQNYARECLDWIGENMGIGLASVLSRENLKVSNRTMAGWQILIWAGTLLQIDG
ncbi:Zn(II)2Cys6 transcription factor domain-containing protein [Aspergillus stella-maris]|uniref:Zn(II)2Cys6 transcription factor domain-containing protein n=1 Tax=Aspergillus stella-maris TaxID=1810926 RepID=UPI003CCD83A0